MKNFIRFLLLCGLVLIVLVGTACTRVPAGNVGIKVYLLGGSKGVDSEELGPGRYWIGLNEELYVFPTFKQNYVWTHDENEGSPNDESFTFQTKDGMDVSQMDIGITYLLKGDKIHSIFQKYRRGVEEITDTFLRNQVRDAIQKVASTMDVESFIEKKAQFIETVEKRVKNEVELEGIIIERIYLIGKPTLPDTIIKSINNKVEARQKALQRNTEIDTEKAEAKKKLVKAQATADAKVAISKAKAESVLIEAKAQAKANKILSQSLTKELIEYRRIQKWDGKLPQVSGAGSGILMNMSPNK